MFEDIMNFDSLRRNIWEFEDIIEINLATDVQAVLGKNSLLYHCIEGILTLPLTLSRDSRLCSLEER